MLKKTSTHIYPYHWEVYGTENVTTHLLDERYLEYRRKWEVNPVNQVVAEFPINLDIEITGRCNLMCTHCTRHSRRTPVGDMAMDLYRRIIDEGAQHDLPSVIPHWLGESFLHPQLIEMIRYAKEKGILEVRVNTNLTLLDEEMARKILDCGLDILVCSIDAVSEETYNRIKVGSDFALINRNLNKLITLREKLAAKKPKIIVQMIDMQKNHEELTSFIDYWRVRVDRVRVATYQSPDGRPNDRNRARNAPQSIFPCSQIWQRLVIAWDGTVYSCIGDNACRDPLGNVKQTSLYDIWHGEKLTRLRELHSSYQADDTEKCLHCDLNKIPNSALNYEKINHGK